MHFPGIFVSNLPEWFHVASMVVIWFWDRIKCSSKNTNWNMEIWDWWINNELVSLILDSSEPNIKADTVLADIYCICFAHCKSWCHIICCLCVQTHSACFLVSHSIQCGIVLKSLFIVLKSLCSPEVILCFVLKSLCIVLKSCCITLVKVTSIVNYFTWYHIMHCILIHLGDTYPNNQFILQHNLFIFIDGYSTLISIAGVVHLQEHCGCCCCCYCLPEPA